MFSTCNGCLTLMFEIEEFTRTNAKMAILCLFYACVSQCLDGSLNVLPMPTLGSS